MKALVTLPGGTLMLNLNPEHFSETNYFRTSHHKTSYLPSTSDLIFCFVMIRSKTSFDIPCQNVIYIFE